MNQSNPRKPDATEWKALTERMKKQLDLIRQTRARCDEAKVHHLDLTSALQDQVRVLGNLWAQTFKLLVSGNERSK
ncbi:hypothetical protein [Variovorax sp. J31P207]|uniref:hypothetical protein n=1 Tax=Variovorax sp. J31P207 TaxID=3053510 RepID=UPI002575FD66|nr:hypothetical protein [Variovorax sp. J31P207]MDM0071461.1 hypothetical protein [Variovorax sp. J31P207]